MLNKLIVYSREDCHLCHDMEQDLRLWQTRIPFDFDVIHIDENELLAQRYGLMIPVLINESDQVICFGHLNPEALMKYVQSKNLLFTNKENHFFS